MWLETGEFGNLTFGGKDSENCTLPSVGVTVQLNSFYSSETQNVFPFSFLDQNRFIMHHILASLGYTMGLNGRESSVAHNISEASHNYDRDLDIRSKYSTGLEFYDFI